MASNQQTMSEKASELYKGAKDSAAEAVEQTKAEYEKAGKYGHQTGKDGQAHIHDGASRAASKTQETAAAANENIQSTAEAVKDKVAPDESKTTFQVVKEKIGLA